MGFVNLLFAIGAATLAGPLLYHLLLRDRAQRRILPTLRFLGQMAPQTYAAHRLKNLLLLLLRLAVLALIVLAFMRPYMKADAEQADPDKAQEGVVFALDTSLSMRAQDRWDNARSRLETLLESQPPDTRLALLLFDRAPRLAVSDTTDNLEVLAALRTAKPGAASTDLLAAIRSACDAASHLQALRKRVYLLSDFQNSALNDIRLDLVLPPGVDLFPVPIDDVDRFNATIQNVRETDSEAKDKRRIVVQAAGFGPGRHTAEVVVRDGGEVLASREIVVDASRPVVADIEFPVETDREMFLTAHLELKDAIDEDNAFPFKIEDRSPIPLLVLAPIGSIRLGDEAGGIPSDANPFLKAAVRACEPRVRSKWLDPSQIDAVRVGDYAVVLALGPEAFPPATIARLQEYVRSGGAVVAFPEKGEGDALGDLVGVEVRGWREIDPEVGYRLVSGGTDGGPFSIPGESVDSLVGHPRASRYLEVSEEFPEGVGALLRFDDGSPFLLARKMGSGSVFCFTVPLDPRATDFPIRASFCPFLLEMFRHATRRAEGAFDYRVGDIVPGNELPEGGMVLAPTGRSLDESGTLALAEPGFYRIVTGGKNRTLAVRTDPEESDLSMMTVDEIDAISRLSRSEDAFTDPDLLTASSLTSSDRPPDASRRLWFTLLSAVLGVMALESLLAARTVR
ncbi:BatA and WFA domain-containing protein [Candidatus Sumerlaeota bacterium]|nr:BatA and WFA domain-containing protein [Candidatus Sumerlaeota bacterium]